MDKIDIPKAYDAESVEDEIYSAWEKSGLFNPDNLEGESFTVMMPPPNVTGVLHLGHAFENSLMDTMVRYQRLQGKKVLLVPGTDHAALPTQARVEDNLRKEGMKNPREELGREKLLEKIRAYAEDSKGTILSQIKKMGTSADWSRLAYTFDDDRSRIVNIVFKKMYDDGLIYRGYRVINWSILGQSTASDDELEHMERKTTLYTFKYGKDFPIPIATTLPETKLGDTAVAVHPDDARYKQYIGQVLEVDIGAEKPLKIHVIADEHVDPEYGTGALGVTPAHSSADFEMYEKNPEIGLIQVVGQDGKMMPSAGKEYAGLPYKQAREKLVQWLRDEGLMISEEEITHNVALSDRFKDEIWPMPMDQWFIDVKKEVPGRGKSLKDLMREAVTTGLGGDPQKKTKILPVNFEKVYLNWIDNLHDWCISRQIWWGHRIPIWTRDEEVYCGVEAPEGDGWQQDPDTLDTWFSSGMWPFSTLGWPDNKDFKTFFPTTWMQMGYEIIQLWMARMILFSAYLHNETPFKDVYIHGMLRAKDGRKFSKSLGNGLDPLEIIKKYGTDALRLSMMTGVSPGSDSKFYEEKVESAQHLVNKFWNIARFILTTVEKVERKSDVKAKTLADEWILTRLNEVVSSTSEKIERFDFSAAAEELREFTWSELADGYLEIAKIEKGKDDILLYILETLLILWHPFIPFVTEELWKQFETGEFLMVQKWPVRNSYVSVDAVKKVVGLRELITAIRNLRLENAIEPKKIVDVVLVNREDSDLLESQRAIIQGLARIEALSITTEGAKPENVATSVVGTTEIFLSLDGLVDLEAEKVRLEKELEEASGYLNGLKSKLDNKAFISNAPEQVVSDIRSKYEDTEKRIQKINGQIKGLV